MGHAQCGFCSGTPPLFRTRCSDDSGRFSVETSALHSDAHNRDNGGSSQAIPTPSLEAPWPSEMRSLGPWTSIHSLFYQRALPLARNQTSVLHSLHSYLTPDDFLAWASNPDKTLPVWRQSTSSWRG